MGELGLNKIFGALLAVGLVILGLKEVSTIVFGGGHHHHKEYESLNAWAESNFKGFRVDIAEVGGGGEVVEEIYDLGALLVSADLSRGERSYRAKCATCHTIDEGGANGTGPNLYGILGAEKQGKAGFSYSGALSSTEGDWSWERMDAWLANPSSYARGTSMAFAGLNRDDERAAVLAYLASYSPDAPEPPAPLPEAPDEGDAEEAAGDLAETDEAVIETVEPTAAEAVEDAAIAAEAAADQAIEAAASEGTEAIADATVAAEAVVEDVTDAADAIVEDASETVEDVATDAVEAAEDATPEE